MVFLWTSLLALMLSSAEAAAFAAPSSRQHGFVASVGRPRRRALASSASTGDEDDNSGGGDPFSMDELRWRIAKEANPYSALFADAGEQQQRGVAGSSSAPPDWGNGGEDKVVHVVAFNGPDPNPRGVHSIEYPPGSGSNVILAFESKLACRNFADLLRKQQFFDPSPQEVDMKCLEAFCSRAGVYAQVVPESVTNLVPPSRNVRELGQRNPSLREQKEELEYVFAMVEGPGDGDDFDGDGPVLVPTAAAMTAPGSWE